MKNKKKKRKGFNASAMRCPYCGASVVYRSADGIYQNNDKGAMLYVCSHYPACDAYVRVHAGTKLPVGSMANRELRAIGEEVGPVPTFGGGTHNCGCRMNTPCVCLPAVSCSVLATTLSEATPI